MTQDDPQVAQALQRLDALQRQMQLLTDTVVHDLRAPLRSIAAFAGRVATTAHERLDADERDQLRRVSAAALRMEELLAALSDWSHAQRAPLQCEPVDVSLLVEWAAAQLQELHSGRVAQVQVQPGLRARGDERLLRRLFEHLLANAWQFADPAAPVQVDVSGEHTAQGLRVVVRDHGIGFDPRYAAKLFEPLQRLHGPDEGARHGLGLATAQCIAQRHGGTITADSRPGDGASFTVTLPEADGDAEGDA